MNNPPPKHFIFLILGCLLAACQAQTPDPAFQEAQLASAVAGILTSSPPATATLAPTPTATLTPPPTATPTPTLTPTVTSTPLPTFPPLPQAEPIRRGPYLQSVRPDSIWVAWDTDQSTRGYVEFGEGSALNRVAIDGNPVRHHEVLLDGLKPYTLYSYRVGGDSLVSSFRSAAGPQQTSFNFAIIGDTRSNPEAHAGVIAQMAKVKPDFALHLGDLVDDGKESTDWDNFLKIENPLMRIAPLYPTLGNHEAFDPQYFKIFRLPGGERWYSFDYGRARFIVLQVDSYATEPFKAGGEQRAWLDEQMAGSQADWLFVSFHIPIHNSWGEDPSEVNLRKELEPLFQKYRVSAVFAGHYHQYERIQTGGILYITGGGGGAPPHPFSTPEPGSLVRAVSYQFIQVEINASQATGTVINLDGKVIDQFNLTAR